MARRILLLITDLEIGGTPTVVRELAMRLHRPPQVIVEVACLKKEGPVGKQLRDAGIQVTSFEASSIFHFPRTVRRLVKRIGQGPFDTVFSFLVHANFVAAIAWRFCRKVRFLQSIQTTQDHPLWKIQKWANDAADRVIVPSLSVAEVATLRTGLERSQVRVIPNAIELAEFSRSAVAMENPRPFPIVFIGRLDPVKRIPDLVAAVEKLKGLVRLDIYGDGSPEMREFLEEMVKRSRMRSHIRLHGSITSPSAVLANAGMLVLPSEAEGFGLVLIEAMAAGVPIVATNVYGIRDVVRDDFTGLLVPPKNPDELAKAIEQVVTQPLLRQKFIAAGLAEVHHRYTWDSVLPAYREVLGL